MEIDCHGGRQRLSQEGFRLHMDRNVMFNSMLNLISIRVRSNFAVNLHPDDPLPPTNIRYSYILRTIDF